MLFTCSAVFSKFSISKLLVRLVCLTPVGMFCGSVDDGAGELSTSGENTSLPKLKNLFKNHIFQNEYLHRKTRTAKENVM